MKEGAYDLSVKEQIKFRQACRGGTHHKPGYKGIVNRQK